MTGPLHGIGMTSLRTRTRLIERLRAEGIVDARVLDALLNVPRHMFVDEALASRAYEDTALPIGHNQTISQPYMVARMSELLLAGGTPARVLEVGTGSGYQTAVLAPLVGQLYSVERIEALHRRARRCLQQLGLRNLHMRLADGWLGWVEHAPYDGIIVTAAAEQVPVTLLEQLAVGGRMVIPVGDRQSQDLMVVTRAAGGYVHEFLEEVNFVPLVREGG